MRALYLTISMVMMAAFLLGCDETGSFDGSGGIEQPEPEDKSTGVQGLEQDDMSCPDCDDQDPCTEDFCSENTNYTCMHDPILPCCGNSLCEQGETNAACAEDCPECEAGECQEATFDHETQECIIEEIVPCCGNSECEDGELYETCPDDCPQCATDKECFRSEYDHGMQACREKPIVPCCGNGICDLREGCDDCPEDCECEAGTELSDYPGFLSDGTLIVVGDKGTSKDVVTATGLTTSLAAKGIETESEILSLISSSKLASEDIIGLGGPCINALWEDYFGVECDEDYIEENKAVVKLVIKGGREMIMIAGDTPADTDKAANALSEDADAFDGMEVWLDTSGATAKVE